MTATTGPNVSTCQINEQGFTFVRIVGAKKFAPSSARGEPPTTHVAPSDIAASTFSFKIFTCNVEMTGPIMMPSFVQCPTFNRLT